MSEASEKSAQPTSPSSNVRTTVLKCIIGLGLAVAYATRFARISCNRSFDLASGRVEEGQTQAKCDRC